MRTDQQGADDEFRTRFAIDEEDLRSANEQVRKHALLALGLWSGYLETYNAMVQTWTEAHRDGIVRLMKALAKAGEEPDITKRADMVAGAYMDQFEGFFKDLASANLRALAVGNAYTQKVMQQAAKDVQAVAGVGDFLRQGAPAPGQPPDAEPSPEEGAGPSPRKRKDRT